MYKFGTALVWLFLVVSACLALQSTSAEQMYDDSEDKEEADILDSLNFTQDAHTNFRQCLCEGTSLECRAIISEDDFRLTVTDIHRNGSFTGKERSCNFYSCQIDILSEVVCRQIDRDTACGLKQSSELIESHDLCCDQVCQRLFWENIHEALHFEQAGNVTDKCKASCLCSAETTTDQTPSETNATTLNTEVEQVSTGTPVSTENTLLINTTELVGKSAPPPGPNNDDTTNTFTNMTAQKFSDNKSDSNSKIIIIIVVIAVVSVLCIVITIIMYKRRNRRYNVQSVENGNNRYADINMDVRGSAERLNDAHAAACSADNNPACSGENTENFIELGSGNNNTSPAGIPMNNSTPITTLVDSTRSGQTSSPGELGTSGPKSDHEHISVNNESDREVQLTHSLLSGLAGESQPTTQEDEDVDFKQPLLNPTDTAYQQPV